MTVKEGIKMTDDRSISPLYTIDNKRQGINTAQHTSDE